MVAAEFVTKHAGGFFQVVNQLRFLRRQLGGMMIDNQPVRLVQPRLETQVTDPGGGFLGFALPPGIVMVSLQRDLHIEDFSRQALQQHSRDQSIQVALVRQNHVRFGQ